jgi:hypothetical protein
MKKDDNSYGTASVVLGILSIVLSSLPGIILAIVGIVFANKQRKIESNKWAKNGKVLGIVGLILGIVTFGFAIWAVSQAIASGQLAGIPAA